MMATLTHTKAGKFYIDCQECQECREIDATGLREAGRVVDDHNRIRGHAAFGWEN